MVATTLDPGHYELLPHVHTQFLGIAICPDPHPLAEAYVHHRINYNSPTANEESSGGAIKDMYGDGNH